MNNTTYSTGSVSVAASGTTVTGDGTAWQSSGIRAGDLIMIAGLTAQIATVTSNTTLMLKRAWPGAAQSGANYDIIMLDDEVRGLIAANALLQALSGGTLTSLGQITGEANQIPWWTGTGVMGATGLTAEARNLLGSSLLSRSGDNLVTAAAARFTGGAVVQSALDATPGRIPTTGWMGLGVTGTPPGVGDLNGLTTPSGLYSASAETTGTFPAGTGSMVLFVERYAGFIKQTATYRGDSVNAGRTFIRTYNATSGAWGAWREILTSGQMVQSPGDTTSGRLISVGWMGLGDTISSTAKEITDWNAAIASGTYWSAGASAAANAPLGLSSLTWMGTVVAQGASNLIQIAVSTGGDRMAIRRRAGAVWVPWQPVAIGEPERGSNANGEYVKFADGTLICTTLITDVPRTSAAGLFKAASYPAAFIAAPVVSYTLPSTAGDYTLVAREGVGSPLAEASNNGWRLTILRLAGQPDVPVGATITNIQAIAIGRWK